MVASSPKLATEPVKAKKVEVSTGKKVKSIHKIGGSAEQDAWAMAIYKQCGNDINAVYMVEAESGFRKDIVSKANKNGTKDFYLFQFNSTYHKDFIKKNGGKDAYAQIEYGCNLYKGYKKQGIPLAKRWYGYAVINKRPGVKDRFTIVYE